MIAENIKNIELEKYCLALQINYPDLLIEYNFIDESDFTLPVHKSIFTVLKGKKVAGETIDKMLVANTMRNLRIPVSDDIDIGDYIVDGIAALQINASKAKEFFKELKKVTVRREIAETASKIVKSMKGAENLRIDEIIKMADSLYNERVSLYDTEQEFVDIYSGLEEKIEWEGNNPLTEFGMQGPFPSINSLYGSLLRDGNITLIGARSSVGKTSFGMHYLNWVAGKYNIPILHLDCGEMSEEELQYRAMCMFSCGKIPLHILERRLWRHNPEMERIVRDVWPKVKKIKHYYKDISGKSRDEIISLIRRFYYSKIGRGNKCLIHYDYLKPFDLFNVNTPEWKEMGHFVQEVKSLIKELRLPFWTSLQLNRIGITGNKTQKNIDDTENTFSMSDRIYQQVTHAFLMRFKTLDEQSLEHGFGNIKLLNLKARFLGERYQDVLNPVKTADGSLQKNYIHFKVENFFFEELGDLASTHHKMGHINIGDEDGKEKNSDDVELV